MSSAYPLESPIEVTGNGVTPGQVNFSDGANSVEVKAPPTLTGTVNFTLPDSDGAANQVLKWPASGSTTIWADKAGPGGGNTDIWFIGDQKASGTDGGAFISGAWRTRVLNTLAKPSGTGTEVQLAVAPAGTNQILIQDGFYRIEAVAPALRVQEHQARLRNITDVTTEAVGTSSNSNAAVTSFSFISGVWTVSGGPKVYEIQQQGNQTRADGFGTAAGFGEPEVYTRVFIERISD
jgi:hypothetical protein